MKVNSSFDQCISTLCIFCNKFCKQQSFIKIKYCPSYSPKTQETLFKRHRTAQNRLKEREDT